VDMTFSSEQQTRRMHLNVRELQQLDAAILSHSQWITQLQLAIADGSSKFDPNIVMIDNRCEFGRWLYEDFPKDARSSRIFEPIRDTHAAFHLKAANILRLALSGNGAAALEQMSINGDFMRLSGHLILQLKELRET